MLDDELTLPMCTSALAGFTVAAELGKKSGSPYHDDSAHNQFIKLTITADGTNQVYPGHGNLDIYLYFISPGVVGIHTFANLSDSSFYISVPADDQILHVHLTTKHDDPEYAGVNLMLMSREMGDDPYYSLRIIPNVTRMQ